MSFGIYKLILCVLIQDIFSFAHKRIHTSYSLIVSQFARQTEAERIFQNPELFISCGVIFETIMGHQGNTGVLSSAAEAADADRPVIAFLVS